MPAIRLLVSVAGDGPVSGNAGEVLNVDARTAKIWCDGERAERVIDRTVPVETTAEV